GKPTNSPHSFQAHKPCRSRAAITCSRSEIGSTRTGFWPSCGSDHEQEKDGARSVGLAGLFARAINQGRQIRAINEGHKKAPAGSHETLRDKRAECQRTRRQQNAGAACAYATYTPTRASARFGQLDNSSRYNLCRGKQDRGPATLWKT